MAKVVYLMGESKAWETLHMVLLQMDEDLQASLQQLGALLEQKGWVCATAESCTGGLLGACMTTVPGASAWFSGGVMAYANAVKVSQLDVSAVTLMQEGAVSEACVRAMAQGLCAKFCVDVGVSISGVAGPSGGSVEKPVGTVWIGYAVDGVVSAELLQLQGSRENIRTQAVQGAVQGLLLRLASSLDV